jgi:thiol-disulfide isomerase/thioredoxin
MPGDPVPIWQLPSFSSLFASSVVGGTALDGGHVVDSANALLFSLTAIVDQATDATSQSSKAFAPQDTAILTQLITHLQAYRTLAATNIKESTEFLPFLSEFTTLLDNLAPNALLLIPGGWDGKNDAGSLTYIVERTGDDTYSFVTCNGGCAGIEYHPSSSNAHGKLKFKTCIRVDKIAGPKIKDKAFWSTMFSLWLKKPAGEYQRGEVIYDVLLPWLAGGLLPEALALTTQDPRAQWRTPCKSSGSATYKSLWESIRYLGLHLGLAPSTLKQLSFCIRQTLLDTVGRDLEVMEDPSMDFQMYRVPNPNERSTRAILTSALPLRCSGGGTMEGLEPLDGKIVALYFSASWCGPCQQFTPLLKTFYTAIKRLGKPFEIVFVR